MVFLKGILLVQGKAVTQPVHFFQCHLAEFIRGVRPVKSITVKLFLRSVAPQARYTVVPPARSSILF